MKADHQSYRRATTVCLLGLAIQLVLTLILLLYGIFGRDALAMTASGFVGIGLIVWISLAIVYDQHRRERIEAMEAEAFAESDAAASSVFEEGGDELRVAARRLASLYRYFMPVTSLVVGGLLLGLGIWRFGVGKAHLDPDSWVHPAHMQWAMVIGLVVALAGFIFARFVSGMAKQPMWANLRAGAAYAVGAALFGLFLTIGHFVDSVGPDTLLRYLQIAYPIAIIVFGAEVFLNFVLNLYRPRQAGETPRPAFDSRLLGFVATPDRIAESINEAINYQFGVDVTGSWFYQLLSRSILLLVGLGVVVIWAMTLFAVVQPDQRGMILRFGRIIKPDVGPGLHVKAPWPIDRLMIPEYRLKDAKLGKSRTIRTTTGVRTIQLGTLPPANKGPVLWTNEHATQERYMLVQPTPSTRAIRVAANEHGAEAGKQIRDYGLVSVGIPLLYKVTDPEAYELLASADQRDELLRVVAQREVFEYLTTVTVDDALSRGRSGVADKIWLRIQDAFSKLNPDENGVPRGAGVEVLFVGIENVHPPGGAPPAANVAKAFEAVVQAEQIVQAKIEQARKDKIETLTRVVGTVDLAEQIIEQIDERNRLQRTGASEQALVEQDLKIEHLLEEAGGDAAATILAAKAERWKTHMGHRGRAAEYRGQLASYRASPMIYKADLYFEALKKAIRGARLYITSEDVPDLRVRFNLEDRDTGADVFEPKTGMEDQ